MYGSLFFWGCNIKRKSAYTEDLRVKESHKKIQDFLFLAIILVLVIASSFQNYCDSMEREHFRSQPAFSTPHPEGILADEKSRCQIAAPDTSAIMLILATNPLKGLFYQSFRISFPIQQARTLRC